MTAPLLPPILETGQPDKLITQGDLPADACCRGGEIGMTCLNCVNNPANGGARSSSTTANNRGSDRSASK